MTARKRKAFSKSVIANYWMCYEQAYGEQAPWSIHGWDWGEPACMACGYWREEWDAKKTVAGRWNASTLEKCHVIPFSKGNPEHVSNMVLMCGLCHLNNPHTDDPEIMYAYMRQRNLLSHVSHTLIHGLNLIARGIDPLDDLPSLFLSLAAELHFTSTEIEATLKENLLPYLLQREADMQRVQT